MSAVNHEWRNKVTSSTTWWLPDWEDYTDYDAPPTCRHEWQVVPLFTSTVEVCKHCKEERQHGN